MNNRMFKLILAILGVMITIAGIIANLTGHKYLSYSLMTVVYLDLMVLFLSDSKRIVSSIIRIVIKVLLSVYILSMVAGAVSMLFFHNQLPAGYPEEIHFYTYITCSLIALSIMIIYLILYNKNKGKAVSKHDGY